MYSKFYLKHPYPPILEDKMGGPKEIDLCYNRVSFKTEKKLKFRKWWGT